MQKESKNQGYDAQIALLIEDFVQMWVKFENMLHNELTKTHKLGGPGSAGLKGDGNYGLFYRVSSAIRPGSRITMGDLSGNLSVSMSKATRVVDWLTGAGYLERSHDTADRRIVRVALTEKGEELHRAMGDYINRSVGQLISSSLTQEQKVVLFKLINKVAGALKTAAA